MTIEELIEFLSLFPNQQMPIYLDTGTDGGMQCFDKLTPMLFREEDGKIIIGEY